MTDSATSASGLSSTNRGMSARPLRSVTYVAEAPLPRLATCTAAPSTGAPVESRVTHTTEPYRETLALTARSVTCAMTLSDAARARLVPGRSV